MLTMKKIKLPVITGRFLPRWTSSSGSERCHLASTMAHRRAFGQWDIMQMSCCWRGMEQDMFEQKHTDMNILCYTVIYIHICICNYLFILYICTYTHIYICVLCHIIRICISILAAYDVGSVKKKK